MKGPVHITTVAVIVFAALLFTFGTPHAARSEGTPIIPPGFYGTIKIGGVDAPAGTEIRAYIAVSYTHLTLPTN